MTEKIKETPVETPTETPIKTDTPETPAETDSHATAAETEATEVQAEQTLPTDETLTEVGQEETSEETEETPEDLQSALETAQAEAAKNLAGWQRAAADLANYKRRQEEQASRYRVDITANVVRDLLPALDDLDLAFQNLPDTLDEKEVSWVEGFKLVQRKLLKTLENNNIQMITSEGEFDPNLHEAVTYEENPDHEPNTIIAELRKGYTIGERVLRPALVRVAK